MNDYEDGMSACFDAAKTWMAVSFTDLFFLMLRMLMATHWICEMLASCGLVIATCYACEILIPWKRKRPLSFNWNLVLLQISAIFIPFWVLVFREV